MRTSHYSIPKGISLTRSPYVEIAVQPDGEMDYHALTQALLANRHLPAIIVANIGTTMVGAIDDVAKIKQCLKEAGITDYFIHCDAALHGLILPFCQNSKFFNLKDIDTLAISGHKLIGAPFPCGIFLCETTTTEGLGDYIEYVHVRDLTLSGSRNGLSPLVLWHEFYLNAEGLALKVKHALESADYAVARMQEKGIAAWKHQDSPIVVFPKPSDHLIKKWQLAPYKDIAHIVTLSHVTQGMIDDVISDLLEEAA